MKALMQYDWPGNVRELENCVERAVALGNGQVIDLGDLPPAIASGATAGGMLPPPDRPTVLDPDLAAARVVAESPAHLRRLSQRLSSRPSRRRQVTQAPDQLRTFQDCQGHQPHQDRQHGVSKRKVADPEQPLRRRNLRQSDLQRR